MYYLSPYAEITPHNKELKYIHRNSGQSGHNSLRVLALSLNVLMTVITIMLCFNLFVALNHLHLGQA